MINERILDFLDGSLSHEEEAELLHRLSVSPEKRGLLRSYLNQAALFARDKQSIAVPYKAEQMLWQRMATVLPPVPMATAPAALEEVAAPAAMKSVGFFGKVFNTATGAIAGLTLVAGIGAGYLLGTNNTASNGQSRVTNVATTTPSLAANSLSTASVKPEIRYVTRYIRVPGEPSAEPASLDPGMTLGYQSASLPSMDLGQHSASLYDPVAARVEAAQREPNAVTSLRGILDSKPIAMIGGDYANKPYLHKTRGYQERPKTLLERFEFGVTEDLGREFPNSMATNSSMPIITNSAFNTFFQLSPNSTKFWAGAAFGTANITKKSLYTRAGNQLDRLQDVLVADTVHNQSTYIAGFLQYRVPAFVGDMTFTAGYGLATLGQMYIGEIGMHYDISREVGIQVGLRGMQFHYSLAAERDAAVKNGSGSLVIPKGVEDASPSFNLELGTGLYFHF